MRRAAVGAEVRFLLAALLPRWWPAILSVPGATLRVMDTLSNISDTNYEIPLCAADQTALRPALLHDLGAMPFESGALISRSLWVIFIGEWGVWTHAVLPVDDMLDMPDRKSITGLCDLVGSLMRPSVCHDDEKAMIVLRRPGPAEISEADAYIFRLVRQAVIGRETAPWTFHVVGPERPQLHGFRSRASSDRRVPACPGDPGRHQGRAQHGNHARALVLTGSTRYSVLPQAAQSLTGRAHIINYSRRDH